MPPKQPQTINIDRIRLNGPWAAWWAMFCVACIGVWYLRGAKSVVEQVVIEVRGLREETKQAREIIHVLDVRVSTLEEWKRSRTAGEKSLRQNANGWGEQ